jgi:hypothetical protein
VIAKAFGPILLTLRPGDIVIMDNLGSHKGKIVFAPPGQALLPAKILTRPEPLAKLKDLLRKAAARTVDTVCAAINGRA